MATEYCYLSAMLSVERMLTSTSSPLKTALVAFENALSPNQKAQLLSFPSTLGGSSEVLAFTNHLYDADATRQSRCIANKLSGFLESVMQFSSAIDTFAQVEQRISSLVWGSVKVVMLVRSSPLPNGALKPSC
jgi:hypothetical protein